MSFWAAAPKESMTYGLCFEMYGGFYPPPPPPTSLPLTHILASSRVSQNFWLPTSKNPPPAPSYWICLCLPQIERLMLHDIPSHKVLDCQGFPKPLI